MPRKKQRELGIDPLPAPKADLLISGTSSKVLSPAQTEFNRRMKALEKARAAHDRERAQLDKQLQICRTRLMPLVKKMNQAERDLVFTAVEARQNVKLTPRRHKWFGDLISGKAADLLDDRVGLSEEDLDRLEALVEELGTSFLDEERKEMERTEFEMMRSLMQEIAQQSGVNLDLSGLEMGDDPLEFEAELQKRFAAAGEEFHQSAGDGQKPPVAKKRQRKPSKAALERERLRAEMEEAKTRDFKLLYKQLAKVLHPDLETNPKLKAHKEVWMKRLTAAHTNGDLRDMLEIEMEWLGEEAGNLANASEEKLRIYAMVLKEQTDEMKERTQVLAFEPQYHLLDRFCGPFGGRVNPGRVELELADEILRIHEMRDALCRGGAAAREMIHQWADAHAGACKRR